MYLAQVIDNDRKMLTMKHIPRILVCLFMMLSVSHAKAQANSVEVVTEMAEKKYDLRPEFTARGYVGFFNSGYKITGGVNINNKRTAGLMLGYHDSYHDYAPGNVYAITTALYYRRYFHLGKRQVCAFYIDAYAGAGWVYKVDEWFPQSEQNQIGDVEKGDVIPFVGLHPGFRVRLYKNLHIFLGPTIGTDCLGLHLGIGF